MKVNVKESVVWDPALYLHYADHRERPFHELLSRVGGTHPRRVVDLGCGPGTLTAVLAKRWPHAQIQGIDSSEEMVEAARTRGLQAEVGDITTWMPTPGVDVVITNAALQWVPGHVGLLTSWAQALSPGSWLAVQVPGNFGYPSHVIIRELARSPAWQHRLRHVVLRGEDAVLDASGYAGHLARCGCRSGRVGNDLSATPGR